MFPERLGLVAGLVVAVFLALIVRLGALQFGASEAELAAELDVARDVVVPAVRGAIRDREGVVLRASRSAFDVEVFAAEFRERSAVEALADLGYLLRPDVHGDRDALLQTLETSPEAAAELAALSLDVLRLPAAEVGPELERRGARLLAPHGGYLRPASTLRSRPVRAMSAAAPRGRAPTERERRALEREIRARTQDGARDVGAALGVAPEDLVLRVREEQSALARLGAELGLGDARAVRAAVRALCDRQFERMRRIVEERLHDAILAQDFGARRFGPDDGRSPEALELAAEVAAPFPDPADAAEALAGASAILGGSFPGAPGSPAPERFAEAVAAAAAAGLYDVRPDRVRAAAARRATEREDFDLDAYHDERKRTRMREDLAAFRADVLARGGGFALADLVDGPGGLRALGFRLAPSFGRDPARAHRGTSLALLLGFVSDEGVPTSGVEARLDEVLRGAPGLARVGGDGAGTVVRPPAHGRDVALTLSARLQDRLEKIVEKAPSPVGAAAVVDVRTGGILAGVTWPKPDADRVEAELAERLAAESERVAARRALNAGDASAKGRFAAADERVRRSAASNRAFDPPAQQPPGSVFKALTLLCALEKGVVRQDEVVVCDAGDRPSFGCHDHGPLDLLGAIERSCNVYCYEMGKRVGAPTLVDFYEKVGLFEPAPGLSSAAEARRLLAVLRRDKDDVRNLAIGQGSLSFAPYRAAGVAAALASGRLVRPHLYAPEGFEAFGPPIGSDEHLRAVREGMVRVAVGEHGTARRHRRDFARQRVAGKTGTAQLTTEKPALYAAWFVGFAPYGGGAEPRYAFAVMFDRTKKEGADTTDLAVAVVDACYDVLGGAP